MKNNFFKIPALIISTVLLCLTFTNHSFSKETPENKFELLSKRMELLEYKAQTSVEQNEKLIQSKVDLTQAIANEAKAKEEQISYWLNLITIFLGAITLLAVVIPIFLQNKQKKDFEKEIDSIKQTFHELKEFEKNAKLGVEKVLEKLNHSESEIDRKLATLAAAENQALSHTKTIEEFKNTLVNIPNADIDLASTKRSELDNSPIAILREKAFEFANAGNWFEAIARWKSLINIDKDTMSYWFGIGVANQSIADNETAENRIKYLVDACEAYQEVVRIKPDAFAAYNNWGNALVERAKFKTGADKDKLLNEAVAKYQEALKIKPDEFLVYNNWGLALSEQAKLQIGADQDKLFNEAVVKYQESLRINPSNYAAYNDWGNLLLIQAQLKNGDEADKLFAKAEEVLNAGEIMSRGACSYNLACLKAVLKDYAGCEHWLNICKETNNLPNKAHVLSDADLTNVANQIWYKNFVESLPGD